MRIVICLIFMLVFTKLFSKASGGLNLARINAVSMAYYYLLFYEAIGACLVYCGFRNHYILQKVYDASVFDAGFYWIVYALIAMPITIIVINKLSSRPKTRSIVANIVDKNDDVERYYSIVFFLTIICMVACVYTFYNIGYVSFFKMLFSNTGFDFLTSRISNAKGFGGNVYIRNFLYLNLSPILAFASYIFYKGTKTQRWKFLVIINFVMAILAKTYDFSKAPIIVFFIVIYIIDGFFEEDNRKSFKRIIIIGITIVSFICFSYIVTANFSGGNWISLSNGPLSRLLITQLSGFYMHLDVFPNRYPFLGGASFPGWVGSIFGQSDWGLRSAKIIMQVVNPSGVAAGTAGVANTIYLGEAYANWGVVGLILSPIYVGTLFGFLQKYITTHRKRPIIILYYVVLLNFLNNTLEGGFVDFIGVELFYEFMVVFIIDVVGNGLKIRLRVD